MAKKAELNTKINLDSSAFQRGIAKSKKSVSTFASTLKGSLLPVLGAAGAAGAMISLGRSALTTAKEIKSLAVVSGVGVEEFQKFAFAAKTVGMDQSKLADIFKDTSDKMGDFMQAGSGPMVDFFEQIAPMVGATKEEFIGLSGPEALQKYFDYLQDANIPHADMVFYMEAIASDATMLIPLLQDGGEAFKTLGDGAEEAGHIIKGDTIDALVQAQNNLEQFKNKATIVAGNIIGKFIEVKDQFEETAKAQLTAEDGLESEFKNIKHSQGGGRSIVDVKAQQRNKEKILALAKELRDVEEAAAAAVKQKAIDDAIARRKALDDAKEAQEAESAAKKASADADKLLRQEKSDARKADADARKAEREAEEAEQKALLERLNAKKIELLKAQAAQDVESTHEAEKQLDLEERTQAILESSNVDRATAVKLAKDLQKAEAGADTNQSGYITPREQRAQERKDKKAAQEQRRREREERSAEVAEKQRQMDKERDDRMTERERANGIDTGNGGGDGKKADEPSGEKAKDNKKDQELSTNTKETAQNTKDILSEIQKNP